MDMAELENVLPKLELVLKNPAALHPQPFTFFLPQNMKSGTLGSR
jgi:hypothetical protein